MVFFGSCLLLACYFKFGFCYRYMLAVRDGEKTKYFKLLGLLIFNFVFDKRHSIGYSI